MKKRKIYSTVVAMALLVVSLYMPGNVVRTKASGYGLSNPTIEKDVVISGDDGQREEGTISNPLVKATVTTWDCIYFGNYWQEDTNGDGTVDKNDEKTPIKWRVLSVDGDDAFLLADQNLDRQQYNKEQGAVTWETCTLRNWLNSTFVSNAFSEEEQAAIKTTKVINEDNLNCGTDGGNDTMDKVYLLSINEASDENFGFNGLFSVSEPTKTRTANETWWLRSPSSAISGTTTSSSATTVGEDGSGGAGVLGFLGQGASNWNGVRPVLHLDLSVRCWEKANVVRAEDICSTWDCVYFGKYCIDSSSTVEESIKWRVLSVTGDDAFLVSDQVLDCQRYNESDEEVTWETSTLRKWLNDSFMNEAFSTEEQDSIKDTAVVNQDNSVLGTNAGNNTTDKVFLLSIQEASNLAYGFEPEFNYQSKTRRCGVSGYARVKGATGVPGPQYGYDPYWLRTPGDGNTQAAAISWAYGTGRSHGYEVNKRYAVRPAIHINLSSAKWKDAGTVSSSGEITDSTLKGDETGNYSVANPIEENSVSKWDCIYFGNYWQNDTNEDGKADESDEKQPIKWRVLSVKGEEALILADKILDCQIYNDTELMDIEWAGSAISEWLNDSFLNTAFSSGEQAAINKTRVVCKNGGGDYEDESVIMPVYLLSQSEVETTEYKLSSSWISAEESKQAKSTVFAKTCGIWEYEDSTDDDNAAWLLRSLQYGGEKVIVVNSKGKIDSLTGISLNKKCGIRPALRINLKSDEWQYAGKVYEDGTVIKPEDISDPTQSSEPQSTVTPPTITPSAKPANTNSSSVALPISTPSNDPMSTITSSPADVPSMSEASTKEELKKVDIKSIKSKKGKKVTLSWKKVKDVKGYEIQYTTSKKWKGKKTKKTTKTKYMIKNLKKGKTYYIRIRAYTANGGKKIYGKWSKVKKIKIKK